MNASRVDRRVPPLATSLPWAVLVVCAGAFGPVAALPAAERSVQAAEVAAPSTTRGLELLLSQAYLPHDFDQQVFDDLWTTWEEPARSRAEQAGLPDRRLMTMERYGLTPHPDDPSRSVQYVVDPTSGSWTMSCLACHQGQVDGRVIPGLPNSNYALETLTEEVRLVKVRQRKPFGHMDMGSLLLPLGTTNGTTNAVMFGVALMRHRDKELNIVSRPPRFDLAHHDMDAPAWWNYSKRRFLYADAFAPTGHRMLMQFLLVKENGPERFAEWEDDFVAIETWLKQLQPPKFPGAIDAALAAQGRPLFRSHCAGCHGTYGSELGEPAEYPERIVAIDEIGTDRARFESLAAQERLDLNDNHFAKLGHERPGSSSARLPPGRGTECRGVGSTGRGR